jgi:threonine aldolase
MTEADPAEVPRGDGDAPSFIDLRSDTVTRPTAAMREAIANAPVGDEVYGDDPTMRRLEVRMAELLGKERALFLPSGTMANQVALAVLGSPGTGVLVESRAHIVHWEEGGAGVLSGLQLRPIETADGLLTPARVAEVLNPRSRYLLRDRVLALENTHMDSGGRVMSLECMAGHRALADEAGLRIHLDGARLWNAAVALSAPASDLAGYADTVMVALSKGLGAPVGSMLAGDEPTMREAWHVRRRLGGAMRQTGILAAAVLHALDHQLDRLARDHELATQLAQGIRSTSGLHAALPETNIVFIEVDGPVSVADNLLKFLENRRILMTRFGRHRLRAVTHQDVDRQAIVRTLATLAEARAQT